LPSTPPASKFGDWLRSFYGARRIVEHTADPIHDGLDADEGRIRFDLDLDDWRQRIRRRPGFDVSRIEQLQACEDLIDSPRGVSIERLVQKPFAMQHEEQTQA
jgi:hypothetical protein